MKTSHSQSNIGGAILVFSLLFGIGIALSTTSQAQNQDDRYAQDRRPATTTASTATSALRSGRSKSFIASAMIEFSFSHPSDA